MSFPMPRPPDLETIYATVAIPVGILLLGLIFWHSGNTDPLWAVTALVLVYDPDPRTAYSSAVARMLYTIFGCLFSIGLIFLFGVHKWLMPAGLGVIVFICGYFLQFRGAWRALLVCVALVIGSSIIDPSADLHIATMRGIEVAAGSVLAVLISLPFAWFEARKKIMPSRAEAKS